MTREQAIKFVAVRSIGNFLLLFSLYGVAMTLGPVFLEEVQYRVAEFRGVRFAVAQQSIPTRTPQKTVALASSSAETENAASAAAKDIVASATATQIPRQITTTQLSPKPGTPGFAEILTGKKEQILVPKDTSFGIVIPKIAANAKVFPNIDPSDPSVFLPVLQKGIAHAKGSVFPGMPGNTYLFAHSTDNWWDVGRYNAVFYLLKNLEKGDEIVVFFENRRYEYVVAKKVILNPDDVTFLQDAHKGSEQLVLQTCWPPGTTWQRLYIIAVPKKAASLNKAK
jgi:LPXTG-site transpeptidase (sortase) family protein